MRQRLANSMRALAYGEGAATLVEMLVACLLVAVLLSLALPTFRGVDEPATDQQAKASVYGTHIAAKSIWTEDNHRYISTADLLTKLTPGEPAYTYRADLPETSYSIDPTDVAIEVNGPSVVTICARSLTLTVFCARFDERKQLQTVQIAGKDVGKPTSADEGLLASLGPELAHAAKVDAVDSDAEVSYSRGYGVYAEEDAIAALATREGPQTCFAGPGNTGLPSWDDETGCPEQADEPPVVEITAAPDDPTVYRSGEVAFTTANGGAVDTVECTLDGDPIECIGGTAEFEDLPYGGHTFQVEVTGPGGTDSDSRSWSVISPPTNNVSLDGDGDYAEADYPAGFPSANGTFEVGAWVRVNQLPGPGQLATIMSSSVPGQGPGGAKDVGWELSINSQGMIHFSGWNTPGNYYSVVGGLEPQCVSSEGGSMHPITVGPWHYVSASWAPGGKGGMRVYLNNKVQGCLTKNSIKGSIAANNTDENAHLYVGVQMTQDGGPSQLWGSTPGAFFNGQIATVRHTRNGAPSFVVNPGPHSADEAPPRLYSPAENGRPATFLYDFEQTWDDSMNYFEDLTPYDDAHLSP